MKKKRVIVIAVALFILIDLGVLLYPTVSNYVNSKNQSRAVMQYMREVDEMGEAKAQAMLAAAREYNVSLIGLPNRFRFTEEDSTQYRRLLDTGLGIMGVLEIEKIGVRLSIYHGTDEGVLQVGLGHMQGTSLPVGGAGSHAFVSGHRGLPSSVLLTHLDKLEIGDMFALFIMGEELAYQVDMILTVEPEDSQYVYIDPDMDYCTLVTCTPYGINTQRLLVRGRRADSPHAVKDVRMIYSDAKKLDKATITLAFLVPALPLLVIYVIKKSAKIRKGGYA